MLGFDNKFFFFFCSYNGYMWFIYRLTGEGSSWKTMSMLVWAGTESEIFPTNH